ncbi:hypothetical protein C8J57DRAFT_1403491 [Mycena rebaudengoi]|nr:hypothetical protein C8J57DRAFT_1403491 [Mycena rebaudengoi]
MPPIRRFDSDTTHVSDSELEREAAQEKARKSPKTDSAHRQTHRQTQAPLSDRSKGQEDRVSARKEPKLSLTARLIHVEKELADLQLHAAQKLPSHPHCLIPLSGITQRATADKCIKDIPIGVLDTPLSSFEGSVRAEVSSQLAGEHKLVDEIERIYEAAGYRVTWHTGKSCELPIWDERQALDQRFNSSQFPC